jgi:hypothetical protein
MQVIQRGELFNLIGLIGLPAAALFWWRAKQAEKLLPQSSSL